MTQNVSDEVLGRFARRQADWFERVRNGSLDPNEVGRVVQQLIDHGQPALPISGTNPPAVTTSLSYTLSEPYHVVVPHGKSVVAELVVLGVYGYADSNITDANFPNKRKVDDEFDIFLTRFNRRTHLDDVERLIRADGYEPVNVVDLLVLGNSFRDLLVRFQLIVALGESFRGQRGAFSVVALHRFWNEPKSRHVRLVLRSKVFSGSCQFAVRRVRPSVDQAGE